MALALGAGNSEAELRDLANPNFTTMNSVSPSDELEERIDSGYHDELILHTDSIDTIV